MKKLLGLRPLWALGIYIVLDILCIGMGMGVPFFCILFGLLVGWYIVRYITTTDTEIRSIFRKTLLYASVTAAITLLGMLMIWAPFAASYLFDRGKDLANTGVPMILYEPLASFIGWLVLMIVISPFLQLLTTLFGSYLALLGWLNEGVKSSVTIP